MSQQRVCDVDGRTLDPSFDLFYTVTSSRTGTAKDVCYECARATGATEWVVWTASTALAVDERIRPTAAPGAYAYDVLIAGTTDATEPVWPTSPTLGDQVVDGTVTYVVHSAPTGNVRVRTSMPIGSGTRIESLFGWMSGSGESSSFTTA